MKLSYDRHGKLDFNNGVLDIIVGEEGVEQAVIYCDALDAKIDCTDFVWKSAKWSDKAIQDYCEQTEAKASRRHG